MKGKLRNVISIVLYVLAFISFLGAITANSRGSMLDFSDIARVVFCGLAVACVTAATLLWKAKTAKGKLLVIVIAVAVIIGGGVSSQVKYRNFRQKMQSFSASIFSCNRPVVC